MDSIESPNETRFAYRSAFLTIATIDLDRSVRFYRDLLQREPDFYKPRVYAEFELSGMKLGLFCPKDTNREEFGDSRGSGMSICWEVEDLDEAIAHLVATGRAPTTEIGHASHGREIYIYDPDGNRLILHQSIANTNPLR
ncbi:VOC family protein [Pannus brasiliensis CCIBt3594]|uniref:VOC family protein n=1 Tax=Pannus brasiliensis CCIBt3594 TaxID=1427578 RepID=A0AAW9R0B0_9CHRO